MSIAKQIFFEKIILFFPAAQNSPCFLLFHAKRGLSRLPKRRLTNKTVPLGILYSNSTFTHLPVAMDSLQAMVNATDLKASA